MGNTVNKNTQGDVFAPIKKDVHNAIQDMFNLLSQIMNVWDTRQDIRYWVNTIVKRQEENIASNKDFFSEKAKDIALRKKVEDTIRNEIDATEGFLYDILTMQFGSPFGIFKEIFNLNVPDITISYFIIKVQYTSLVFENISVPDKIRPIFKYFLDNLITNQTFIKEVKYDRMNAIVDTTFENFRLNIVHHSLNSFETPIITIRKHIAGLSPDRLQIKDHTEYFKSLGQPDAIIKQLTELCGDSFCIFGETGSGKTTLMRALIEHNFQDKRNICVIEDSAELQIPTFLSFITNINYTIKDLFTAALRQNPSHIYIGETRTDEIIDIMEAGLTSRIGTTIHANDFDKAIERIYFMSSPRHLSKEDVEALISCSFKVFVYMDKRKIKGVWIRNDKVLTKNTTIFDLYNKITV